MLGHWNSTFNPTGAVGLNLNISADNKIYIDMVAGQAYNGNIQIDTSIWNLICISYDGKQTTNQDKIKLYLNGQLIAVNFNGNSVPNQLGNKANSTFFGARGIGPGGVGAYNNGVLDDIGLWDRALTQQEITDLYNANNLGFDHLITVDLEIYPNPSNDFIKIDAGNLSTTKSYSIKIENNAGQPVFQSTINQAQFYVDLSTWSGNGLYFVHLIDAQGNTVTVRKIVLQ